MLTEGQGFRSRLLDALLTPGVLIFAFAFIFLFLVASVTGILALVVPLFYPADKPDPSPILWCICTSALTASLSLVVGKVIPNP